MTELNCLSQLLVACHAIQELYDVTLYGQRHREVQHLKIVEKLGSRPVASLARKDLRDAVAEVSAIQDRINLPTKTIELSARDVRFIKMLMRQHLRAIRAIPLLARLQAMIALSATFEGYVADLIRQVFDVNPLVLKSGKSTLKDADLIDAIQLGDPLSLLKDYRLRDIMYGTVGDWFAFLRKTFGMTIDNDDALIEMFLLRNAIVHNNGRVSPDLVAIGKTRFKTLGRKLNVTDKDLKRYIDSVKKSASQIWAERVKKFPASNGSGV